METKHYSCIRKGNDYIVVESGPMHAVFRIASAGVGMALLATGVRRRGILGTLSALAGAGLCAHAYSGVPLAKILGSNRPAPSAPARSDSPKGSPLHTDEASMESFPASDAPATRVGSAAQKEELEGRESNAAREEENSEILR